MLTLALGLGAAAAIFSVTDWVLFRARSFPGDVYLVGGQTGGQAFLPWRFLYMVDAYRRQPDVATEWCLCTYRGGNVVVNGEPVGTSWLGTNANFFSLFGVTMERGRGFAPGEDGPSPAPVAVISGNFWRTHLGGREDVIGQKIRIGGDICTIVGVVRAWQVLPGQFGADIYRPDAFVDDPARPWALNLMALVRLKPGVSPTTAAAVFAAAKVDVPAALRQYMTNDRPLLQNMGEVSKLWQSNVYWVLVGAVGFLYAIACLNASNLILLRMLGQRRELCVRLAVGCSRWQLVRFLALQYGALTVSAALGGALVANWVFPLLLRATGNQGDNSARWYAWSLDSRVLIVLGGLTVLTSLLVVLVPALRVLRADVSGGLKEGGATLGESRSVARLRGGLVVAQGAFAVILLVGAGLMVRTFARLREVDLGFDTTRRIKVESGFPADYHPAPEARLARLREICDHLRHLPGVASASFDTNLLLPGYSYNSLEVDGAAGKPLHIAMGMFLPGYENVAGLMLKRGHWLDRDNGNEVMINEALARARWPGQDPVGEVLLPVQQTPTPDGKRGGWTVAGVVGDFRSTMREAPGLWVLGPALWGADNLNTCVVRLNVDYDGALGSLIRRDLYAFEPRMMVTRISPLAELRDQQLSSEHLADSVLRVLSGIALLLTVVGLYSVLAYSVDLRMGEFGVRVALGAEGRDIVKLVVRRGLLLVIPGLLVGVATSLALSRFLRSLLFEVSAQDPLVLAAVAIGLLAVGVIACIVPARRAARVDVARLLRSE